ncbi:Gp37-like protein [Thomasclavelia cocleata]|uniref:Gp37-like protein n=1 Tax=Thomasclavelia cocleata TaxID=69824 RepID=UPI00242E2B3B|nr:hypothetical protein [Thomasclavelia cocleata]
MEIIHARLIEGYYGDKIIENWTTWFEEINIITKYEKAEFQISSKTDYNCNDFEIQLLHEQFVQYDIKEKDWIYIPESEFGGRIEIIDHSEDGIVRIGGPNFRYFLNRRVIWPTYNKTLNARNDYLILENKEANEALQIMCENTYVDSTAEIFEVLTKNTGIYISAKARYDYLFEKMVSVLAENKLRLKVRHSYDTETVPIKIEAVRPKMLNELYNRDFDIEINSKIDLTNDVTMILALGKGELHERKLLLIKHIKNEDEDRFVATVPFNNNVIGSVDSNMWVFDYPNCESDEDLKDKAIEAFKKDHLKIEEISLNIKNSKIELNLGDIISGYDEITGLDIETEITQKILTFENGNIIYTYKVGD